MATGEPEGLTIQVQQNYCLPPQTTRAPATTALPVKASAVPNQLMFCDGDLAVCHTVRLCASAVKNGNAHTLCAIANFNQQHQAKPS